MPPAAVTVRNNSPSAPDRLCALLAELGYRLAAYPLALLAVAVAAQREALRELAAGRMPERQVDFATLRALVGFDAYDRLLDAYAAPPDRV